MKKLMTGDEAVARGAYEAGVRFASAYPGTPSTEILENVAAYKEIKAEWAPNEKVAMESSIGAAVAGARSMVSMKHVGMNVAADPMFTWAYMGVNAGNMIVTADEPGMYSSQNEQDNRNYAKAAKLAILHHFMMIVANPATRLEALIPWDRWVGAAPERYRPPDPRTHGGDRFFRGDNRLPPRAQHPQSRVP